MKRILSVILAATLLFLTLSVPAAAQSAPAVTSAQVENARPVVIVRGLYFDGLTVDAGTPNERNAIGEIKVTDILKTLGKVGFQLVANGKKAAVSELCAYVRQVFECFTNDKNGDPLYQASVDTYPLSLDHYPDSALAEGTAREEGLAHAVMDTVGGDRTYYVGYDWRKSQLDVADEINEMIERALADHPEFDKVTIISASMGGMETIGYLTKYGYDKIQRCVFHSSTFYGAYVAGDCLTGRIVIDPTALCRFVGYHIPALAKPLDLLNKVGVVKAVCKLLQKFVDNNKRQVYDEVLVDTFGTMPGLWGVTPTDYYEDAKEYVFGDRIGEYAGLIERADALQEMAAGVPALIKRMEADGVELCVVAGYNAPLAPTYEHAVVNGDDTLETALMCGGAVVADLGKTLGDDYVPANPEKMTADRVADLSGVILPENTWLVKNAPHVACNYGSECSAFVMWLLTTPEAPNVRSDPRYPQFMLADSEQNLSPLK